MYNIAIVEDDEYSSKTINNFIDTYGNSNNLDLQVKIFTNGMDFLDSHLSFDIVFMDIEMPLQNGMETAIKLRSLNKTICIVFVTNIVQYAVSGYEVGALDFIVKPLSQFNFHLKLEKAIDYCSRTKKEEFALIVNERNQKIFLSDLYYIEILDHQLFYYTRSGIIKERGTLSDKERILKPYMFSRCNNSYLINLKHVSEFNKESIVIAGQKIKISRSKKKEFIDDLNSCMEHFIL